MISLSSFTTYISWRKTDKCERRKNLYDYLRSTDIHCVICAVIGHLALIEVTPVRRTEDSAIRLPGEIFSGRRRLPGRDLSQNPPLGKSNGTSRQMRTEYLYCLCSSPRTNAHLGGGLHIHVRWLLKNKFCNQNGYLSFSSVFCNVI